MVALIIGIVVVVAVLYGALSIILGWVLPAKNVAAFHAFVGRVAKLLLQIAILCLAGGILYVAWMAYSLPTK